MKRLREGEGGKSDCERRGEVGAMQIYENKKKNERACRKTACRVLTGGESHGERYKCNRVYTTARDGKVIDPGSNWTRVQGEDRLAVSSSMGQFSG